MGAYAALLSLSQTLNHALNNDPDPHPFPREQLLSLPENVTTLLAFLKQHSQYLPNESINLLENRIINVAYDAEVAIETRNIASMQQLLQEIHSILKEAKEIKVNDAAETTTCLVSPDPAISSIDTNSSLNTAICEDDFVAIRDRIYGQSSDLEVIPIFGMGGIGKSTLARRLYQDSAKSKRFDRYAWIVVSQDYSIRKILLGLVQSMHTDESKSFEDCSDGELRLLVHKELFKRRYLFVVDDLWSTKAWDDIQLTFSNHRNKSRVLVTTRSSQVASYVGNKPHEMKLLEEDQSWCLLEERVFGKDSCPSNLQQIGMKVAKCCGGLPLLLVVVAGLLQTNITEEYWKSFSQKISSAEPKIVVQCSKVLSLSYDYLPLYLKPCFLYVTAFPEDCMIKVDRLIRLWMAEGFIDTSESIPIEEVAERYIDDLVGRSLLLVSSRRSDGRIQSVTVHDVLRDIGSLKAEEERFYYCDSLPRRDFKQHRLSIHTGSDLYRFLSLQYPMTRSLLDFSDFCHTQEVSYFRLLKILDVLTKPIKLDRKNVVRLRYLAITYTTDKDLLASLSVGLNLQTLYIVGYKSLNPYSVFRLPLKVWKMPSLRHLISKPPFYLEQPSGHNETVEESSLQTLSIVANLELSSVTVEMLANLRKLGLYYYRANWWQVLKKDYQLHNLICLGKIQELEIMFENFEWSDILELKFPSSLKKLSFGCRNPCGDVTALDFLPNVEVLKLRGQICTTGQEWKPVEGQFDELRYLELDSVNLNHWEAGSIHFPSLEILVLKSVDKLEEIPSEIGEIDSLQQIQLHLCKQSLVDSAQQIRDSQLEMGNDSLRVIIAEEDISLSGKVDNFIRRFYKDLSENRRERNMDNESLLEKGTADFSREFMQVTAIELEMGNNILRFILGRQDISISLERGPVRNASFRRSSNRLVDHLREVASLIPFICLLIMGNFIIQYRIHLLSSIWSYFLLLKTYYFTPEISPPPLLFPT